MRPTVLFVGGVHGAGKSTLCNALGLKLGIPHVSAGRLLMTGHGYTLGAKEVDDVAANQSLILARLGDSLQRCSAVVLDGHFTLWQADGQITPVPAPVFRTLSPAGLAVLTASPSEIVLRLSRDHGWVGTASSIELFQEQEVARAFEVGRLLDAPVERIHGEPALAQAIEFFTPLLEQC